MGTPSINIARIVLQEGITLIEYESEGTLFIIKSPERPTRDFSDTFYRLITILSSRTLLGRITEAQLLVSGLETGLDTVGLFYRVSGLYTVFGQKNKVTTGKLRTIPPSESISGEKAQAFLEKNWGSAFSEDEESLFDRVIHYAMRYVLGEREIDGQSVLDFGEDDDGDN